VVAGVLLGCRRLACRLLGWDLPDTVLLRGWVDRAGRVVGHRVRRRGIRGVLRDRDRRLATREVLRARVRRGWGDLLLGAVLLPTVRAPRGWRRPVRALRRGCRHRDRALLACRHLVRARPGRARPDRALRLATTALLLDRAGRAPRPGTRVDPRGRPPQGRGLRPGIRGTKGRRPGRVLRGCRPLACRLPGWRRRGSSLRRSSTSSRPLSSTSRLPSRRSSRRRRRSSRSRLSRLLRLRLRQRRRRRRRR